MTWSGRIAGSIAAATVVAAVLPAAPAVARSAPKGPVTGAASAVGKASFFRARSASSDPSTNNDPSAGFQAACFPRPTSMASCDAAALADFDKARAREGLGPMSLPTGFDSMSVPVQLLVIANIDRVDHGLLPVSALSDSLNQLAQQGAASDADPPFPDPFTGDSGGGNWAGAGTSSLFSEFLWVYDDGLGSGNIDCPSAGDPGCWGHRHNVLGPYDAPLLMGAAMTTDPQYTGSAAEEFISGDTTDAPIDPSWASITSQFPVGVAPTTVATGSTAAQVPVTVWASGEDMAVTAAVTAGQDAWSVSPTSCPLAAGSACAMTVSFDPSGGVDRTGVLTLTGPNGPVTVPLVARAPTRTTLAATTPTAHGSAAVTFNGVVTTTTGTPVSGQQTTLQTEPSGSGWVTVATGLTDSSGQVSLTVHPRESASYRLVSATAGAYMGSTSDPVVVGVTPSVMLHAAKLTVHPGGGDSLAVGATPAIGGEIVQLQQRQSNHWHTVATGSLTRTGHTVFRLTAGSRSTLLFRVVLPASSTHNMAASNAVRITVR